MTDKDKAKDHLIEELTKNTNKLKQDIYIQERVQEILIKAKNEWEQTFDAIPDIVIIIDRQHKIIKANKKLAEKLGVERDDLIGKFCYNIIHGTKEPPSYCPHNKTLTTGEEHTGEIYEDKLRKQGKNIIKDSLISKKQENARLSEKSLK